MEKSLPEQWLRGPVPNVPLLLQPAAHALLQSRDELRKYTRDFPEKLLDEKPAGRASVAFHLKHCTGVLDRMLTYAEEKPLSDTQRKYLENETQPNKNLSLDFLLNEFDDKVDQALAYFNELNIENLTERRTVGRKKLPSTLIGLLFHAAEHSQRHVGQLLVTVSILKEKAN